LCFRSSFEFVGGGIAGHLYEYYRAEPVFVFFLLFSFLWVSDDVYGIFPSIGGWGGEAFFFRLAVFVFFSSLSFSVGMRVAFFTAGLGRLSSG